MIASDFRVGDHITTYSGTCSGLHPGCVVVVSVDPTGIKLGSFKDRKPMITWDNATIQTAVVPNAWRWSRPVIEHLRLPQGA